MLTVTVAGIPQGKGRARFVRKTGVAYTPTKTRSYEGALRHEAALVMDGRPPLAGPLSVTVQAVFPIPASWSKRKRASASLGDILPTKTPDADNLLKVLDAFNEIVWRDDRQIVAAQINKLYGENPKLRVQVEEMGGQEDGERIGPIYTEDALGAAAGEAA